MEVQRDIIIPDVHAPYHVKRSVELILDHVIPAFDWFGIRVLGDFYDCYPVSFHRKDPRRESNFKREIDRARALKDRFEDAAPWEEKTFLEGNHEWRLPPWLSDTAPMLYEWFMANDPFDLKNWDVTPYQDDTKIGQINYTHDVGLAGKYALSRSLEAYQDNMVMGHIHRMDYKVAANAAGVPHVGACFGWLGDLSKVDYMHTMKARSQWTQGFGIAYRIPDGTTWLSPIPIIKGTCIVEGQYFKA